MGLVYIGEIFFKTTFQIVFVIYRYIKVGNYDFFHANKRKIKVKLPSDLNGLKCRMGYLNEIQKIKVIELLACISGQARLGKKSLFHFNGELSS